MVIAYWYCIAYLVQFEAPLAVDPSERVPLKVVISVIRVSVHARRVHVAER